MNFCEGHLRQTNDRREAGAKIHRIVLDFRHDYLARDEFLRRTS